MARKVSGERIINRFVKIASIAVQSFTSLSKQLEYRWCIALGKQLERFYDLEGKKWTKIKISIANFPFESSKRNIIPSLRFNISSLISRFSFSIAEDQGETRSREIGLWPATAEKTMTTRADDPLERVTFAQRSADQRLRRFLLEYAPLFDLRSMHTNARRIRARVTYDLRRRNETKKQLRRIDRVLSLWPWNWIDDDQFNTKLSSSFRGWCSFRIVSSRIMRFSSSEFWTIKSHLSLISIYISKFSK